MLFGMQELKYLGNFECRNKYVCFRSRTMHLHKTVYIKLEVSTKSERLKPDMLNFNQPNSFRFGSILQFIRQYQEEK